MFERYTDRARRAVPAWQEVARRLHRDAVEPEHLLVGILMDGKSLAAKTLEALGISPVEMQHQVMEASGEGNATATGHLTHTAKTKKALELSLREALQLNHNYIGTEHLLLGVIREGSSVAAQALIAAGADLETAREAVVAQRVIAQAQQKQADDEAKLAAPVSLVTVRETDLPAALERLTGREVQRLSVDTVQAAVAWFNGGEPTQSANKEAVAVFATLTRWLELNDSPEPSNPT